MSKKERSFVHLKYQKNRTKKLDVSTATPAKRSLHYFTFGQGESLTRLQEETGKRGVWYDREGAEHTVPKMTEWIEEQAHENKYTFTAILSVRDGEMKLQDFIDSMNSHDVFTDYRLIVHDDTEHDHAHVMMFRDRALKKKDFHEWRKAVGAELHLLEQSRISEKKIKMEQDRGIDDDDYHIDFWD